MRQKLSSFESCTLVWAGRPSAPASKPGTQNSASAHPRWLFRFLPRCFIHFLLARKLTVNGESTRSSDTGDESAIVLDIDFRLAGSDPNIVRAPLSANASGL